MSTNKSGIKEEMASRHWQQVLSFGTQDYADSKRTQRTEMRVSFEVLP